MLFAWYSTALRRSEAILEPRHKSSASFVEANGKLYDVDPVEHECKGSILINEGNAAENNEVLLDGTADGCGGGGGT